MTKGSTFPAAAPPTDRSVHARQAQERHAAVVAAFEEAQRRYVEEVDALPLPELMQGPVVRVTDADSIDKIRTVLELTEIADSEADRLIAEVENYRSERRDLLAAQALREKADELGEAAAAIPREAAWAAALNDWEIKQAVIDAWPLGTEGEDDLLEAACGAMDHLIENVPAPGPDELALKLRLGLDRAADFVETLFDGHAEAIAADFARITGIHPLRNFAAAWIDRWQALGGTFGLIRNRDGSERGRSRGIPMPYVWTPPAVHNPCLEPHQLILEAADHQGAQKMLDSFLALISGLEGAVFDLAEERGLFGRAEARHGA